MNSVSVSVDSQLVESCFVLFYGGNNYHPSCIPGKQKPNSQSAHCAVSEDYFLIQLMRFEVRAIALVQYEFSYLVVRFNFPNTERGQESDNAFIIRCYWVLISSHFILETQGCVLFPLW